MLSVTLEMDMTIKEELPIQQTRGHGQEQGQLRGRAGHQEMEVKVHSMDQTEMILSKSVRVQNLKAIANQLTRSLNQNQINLRLILKDHMVLHNKNGKLD